MIQKDDPTKKDDLRKDYEADPDDFKDKWGIPDDPKTPPPPSQDPTKQ